MTKTFGNRIRQARKKRDLGLRQTAGLVGISPTFLSRVETGKEPSIPSEETIRKLAAVLDDDFDELMRLAQKIPGDIREYLLAEAGMFGYLRRTRELELNGDDLDYMLGQQIGEGYSAELSADLNVQLVEAVRKMPKR